MPLFDVIAFDADDTLWHNERLYERSETDLATLLEPYGVSAQSLKAGLYQTETRNIGLFGYGIKSFALSMIETAVQMTWGRISGYDVLAILELAKAQFNAQVNLFEHTRETISRLAARYPLMVITKGEPQEQERKLQHSGLADFFREIVVVTDKTPLSYATLFKNRGLTAKRLVMVGNALRSDILPILLLGGYAVYVPFAGTWSHEAAEAPAPGSPRFYQIEHLGLLPDLLDKLETNS